MPRDEPTLNPTLAAAVETARMRECYRVAPQSILAMVGAAFLAAALLSREGKGVLAWGWFALMLADAALRYSVLHYVRRQLANPAVTLRNETIYALVALTTGLGWVALIVGLPPCGTGLQMMMVLLLVAIGYTSIITIGISLKTWLAVVAPAICAELYSLSGSAYVGDEVPAPVLILLPVGLVSALAMYRRSVMPGIVQQQQAMLLTRELRAMFDNTLVGIAHIRKRRYVTVNAEYARIYGYTPEQMAGESIAMTFEATEGGARMMEEVGEALRQRGEAVYESRYVRPDGQARHLLAQGHRFDRDDPAKGTIWVLMDMTARKEAELALAASEDAYRRLVETVPSIIFSLDLELRFSFVNDAGVRQIAGLSAGDVLGRRFTDFVLPKEREASLARVRQVLSGETMVGMESRIHHRDGQVVTLSVTAQPLRDAGGRIIGISGTAVDVSERKKRESELQRTRDLLHSAIEAMNDGFILFDEDERVALCNRRYAELYGNGQRPQDLVGKHYSELQLFANQRMEQIPPEFLGDTDAWARERLRRHREANGTAYIYETGDDRWIQITKRRTSDGSVVGIYTDITQMKRTEEAVRILAQHDALTGLPNRRLMGDRLAQAIAQARRNQEMAGLLLIDLDNFKPVNDEHGHRAGDEVLRVVALRLKECVREVDTVARYGGDEFVIVLSAVNRPRDAGLVAEKVIAALAQPIPALWMSQHGRLAADVRIGCSVGISLYPQDATTPDALIRCADSAMYMAKSRGRGCHVFHAAAPAAPPKT
jgi:diguanylate cyclase (GGDEF)-like protein/PAS domain S-box-containing protein